MGFESSRKTTLSLTKSSQLRLLHTIEEHRECLLDLASYTYLRRVTILSFNLSIGLARNGQMYDSYMRAILARLHKRSTHVKTTIVIAHTENTNEILIPAIDLFPQFHWYRAFNCHMKAWLFEHKAGLELVFGGRNLSDSDWFDLSAHTNDQIQIRRLLTNIQQEKQQWSEIIERTKSFPVFDSNNTTK